MIVNLFFTHELLADLKFNIAVNVQLRLTMYPAVEILCFHFFLKPLNRFQLKLEEC